MGRLVKAIGFNNSVRIYAIDSTDIIEEARLNHGLWPLASIAFGRLLTITSVMGSMLKNNQKLTIRFNGDGPLGKMITTSDATGNVKGVVENPQVHLYNERLKKLEVALAVGNGNIIVSKDLGLKQPYVSQCDIIDGEISTDMANYFLTSEQTYTTISSGVLVQTDNSIKAAGGLVIQLLPNCSDEIIALLQQRLSEVKSISRLIESNLSLEEIIQKVCLDDYQILEETHPIYKCDCTKERFIAGVQTLSKEDLTEMVNEGKSIETVCNFCGKAYEITLEELQEILNTKK